MKSQDIEILNSWLKQWALEAKNFIPISQSRKQKDESTWFTAETDGDTGERVWEPARKEGSSYVAEVLSRTSR